MSSCRVWACALAGKTDAPGGACRIPRRAKCGDCLGRATGLASVNEAAIPGGSSTVVPRRLPSAGAEANSGGQNSTTARVELEPDRFRQRRYSELKMLRRSFRLRRNSCRRRGPADAPAAEVAIVEQRARHPTTPKCSRGRRNGAARSRSRKARTRAAGETANKWRQFRTATEMAIYPQCARTIEGVPERGFVVTVYGTNPWNAMLTIKPEAGRIKDAQLGGSAFRHRGSFTTGRRPRLRALINTLQLLRGIVLSTTRWL